MKERLTGAIILVALIVCLVPELLKGPVRSAPQPVDASAEGSSLRSITFDVAADEARSSATTASSGPPAPTPVEPAATPAPAAPVQGANSSPAAEPDVAPAPASRPPPSAAPAPHAKPSVAKPATHAPAPSAHGWLVQVGSFAQRGNAEHLAQQLTGQGFASSVSQSSGGRHLYRVRVGPVHDKAAATQLAAKLRAAGHKGSLVSD